MKNENKTKNKKKFTWPKRTPLLYLIILGCIVGVMALFGVAYVIYSYVDTYNQNKVVPFSTEITGLEDQIVYGDKNTVTDFNFLVYCVAYDDVKGTAEFRTIAWKNENTNGLNIGTSIEIKLRMCSDWIKTDVASASRTSRRVADTPKQALGSSTYYTSLSVSGLPDLPAKGKLPFITINEIPLYVYLTYKTTIKGTQTTKRYILKYDYNDFIIGQLVFDEGTENEVTIAPTRGGIEK